MAGLIKGKDLMFYLVINAIPYSVCRAKDTTISVAAELLEKTTKDGGKSKRFGYQGKNSWTLTMNGLTNTIDVANFIVFQQAILTSAVLDFVLTDGVSISYSGSILVTGIDIDSPVAAISSFNNTLQGSGVLTITSQGVTPPASNYNVTIQDQFGDTIANIPAPGTYNVVRFDTLDLRGWSDPDLVITSQEAVPV